MGELKSQVAMKKTERVAAVAVATPSKRELDALQVRNVVLDLEMTCFHNEVDVVGQARAEVTKLAHDVEKKCFIFRHGKHA